MLINPPIDSVLEHGNVSPVTSYLFYNSAPLGLLYIGAVLEQAGETVAAIDGAAEQLDVARVVRRVEQFQPDLIGIGSFTVSFETTRRLAALPSAVLLSSMGRSSPRPLAAIRSPSIPRSIRNFLTECARVSESSRL